MVPFEPTNQEHIYICPACDQEAKQHINGKILYTKVIWDIADNEHKD